jgi:hypothetical protein
MSLAPFTEKFCRFQHATIVTALESIANLKPKGNFLFRFSSLSLQRD